MCVTKEETADPQLLRYRGIPDDVPEGCKRTVASCTRGIESWKRTLAPRFEKLHAQWRHHFKLDGLTPGILREVGKKVRDALIQGISDAENLVCILGEENPSAGEGGGLQHIAALPLSPTQRSQA